MDKNGIVGSETVFAPPQESGSQAAIENFNGRWHAKVWLRFHHDSLVDLQECSRRYVAAYRTRAAARIEAAPPRCSFPVRWHQDLQAHPRGLVILSLLPVTGRDRLPFIYRELSLMVWALSSK